MLPFLKRKDDVAGSASIPVKMREPDEGAEYDSMHAVAEDLKNALAAGDIKGIAEALRAGFELCESEPHQEESHE